MPTNFYAGMVPTATEMQATVPLYISQGTSQSAVSTISVTDSAIIVPVNGLSEVDLSVRYQTGGGGFRWAWRTTGTVSMSARDVMSAGSGSGTALTVPDGTHSFYGMRWRQIATATEEQATANYNNAGTHLIRERCVVDGVGELVFRFAQHTSNANASTLNPNSFAVIRQVRN